MFQEIEPRELHIEYMEREPEADDFVICIKDRQILVRAGSEELELPYVAEIRPLVKDGYLRYLFRIDDMAFFALMDQDPEAPEGFGYVPVRDIRSMKPTWMVYALYLGNRLDLWYDETRYCGHCGTPMVHSDRERAMKCPKCGKTEYPVICPCVIVAIIDRKTNRLMCTRYSEKHMPGRRHGYALVAGYVESGETPEQTVRREVMEEVGLRVKNIKYYKSQPWPVSGSLLLGFICDLDGDPDAQPDGEELAAAEWKTSEELADLTEDISLTRELMLMFRDGKI